jgi:VanZ family protein
MLAFFASVALILFGIVRLFHLIARKVSRHGVRLAGLLLAALLLVLATLSYDQLRSYLGPMGTQLADLFHFLVIFSLALFLLERVSARTAINAVVAALVAVVAMVVLNVDQRLATGGEAELTSISTVFSLPFLLDVVERGPLTLRILNFLQVYLTFAVIAVSTLLVIGLVHIIYLLHERVWIKLVHGASLAFFSAPFLFWALSTVSPESPLAQLQPAVPATLEALWYANVVLLAALSLWSVIQFMRESGQAALGLFTGLYEEPLNFLGVGLFLTLFVAVFHWFGLSVLAFSVIFLAFAEEYSKHLIVRFTDDDSIRCIDDAIEFSIIVGLAFAFAENVLLYFPRLMAEDNTTMMVLRSVLTVLMHAIASGIFGYFYGLAHFSSHEVRSGHGGRGAMYRLLHRTFLFSRESLYHEAKMFEGLLLAGTYHAAYNLAASQGRIGVMLVLVGAGAAYLYYLLGLKSNHEKLGAIAGERVHPTFAGELKRGQGV